MQNKLIKRILHSRFIVGLSNDNSFKTIVIKVAAPAVISALIAGSVSVIGIHVRGSQIDLLVIAQLLTLLAFASAALYLGLYIAKLVSDIEQQEWFRIDISRPSPKDIKLSPYEDCINAVRFAKKSIIVIGSHFTDEISISTSSHGQYLALGIDHVISEFANRKRNGEPQFVYKRLMQVDSLIENIVSKGVLSADAIVDEDLYAHVQRTLRLRGNGNLEISILARQFLPSFPSVLIVDDEYVFFSLPYDKSAEGAQSDNDIHSEFSYDFVLQLRDKTGRTAEEFKSLFNQLKREGTEIKSVSPRMSG